LIKNFKKIIKMNKIQQFYEEPVAMTWHEAMGKYENHPKWKFPTRNELIAMYKSNKDSFESDFYWSSSEASSSGAWTVNFSNGYAGHYGKLNLGRVRVVRAF